MTDGTSQGLFVVVAIVIFGIFVALSYTAFGSGGLSDSMHNLFETAIEDTKDKVTDLSEIKEFSMTDVLPFYAYYTDFLNEDNQIIFSQDPETFLGGVMFPSTYFEYGKTYTISFDMTKLSGDIQGIGGHISIANDTNIYINGVKESEIWRENIVANDINAWAKGVVYPDNLDTNNVSVTFKVDSLDTNNDNVYIQPNRNNGRNFGEFYQEYGLEYEVMIENIVLYEHHE